MGLNLETLIGILVILILLIQASDQANDAKGSPNRGKYNSTNRSDWVLTEPEEGQAGRNVDSNVFEAITIY